MCHNKNYSFSPSSQNISKRIVTKCIWVIHTIENEEWINNMGLHYWYLPRKIKRIKGLTARIITGNIGHIHSRGVDIVRFLDLETIKDRQNYLLCVLMCRCIHGFTSNYTCNDVNIHFNIHGYDTRSGENMDSNVSSRTITREVLFTWRVTRYVKLRVAHALGMPGTFSPPLPTSKKNAS